MIYNAPEYEKELQTKIARLKILTDKAQRMMQESSDEHEWHRHQRFIRLVIAMSELKGKTNEGIDSRESFHRRLTQVPPSDWRRRMTASV